VKLLLLLLLAGLAATPGSAQYPRFEDYPVTQVFKGKPAPPILEIPEELEFAAVIRDGVNKGWGVFNGTTGREFHHPGPNFAGHYVLLNFGCNDTDYTPTRRSMQPSILIDGPRTSLCLGTAIVDAKTGRVYRVPIPQVGVHLRQYFGVEAESLAPHPAASFHNFRLKSPLVYRLNSRLLITDTCEGVRTEGGSILTFAATGCGAHYYLMDQDGLKLIYRVVE
jgi:hypothetical protein